MTFNRLCELLLEMPTSTGLYYAKDCDTPEGNKERYNTELKTLDNKHIGNYKNYKILHSKEQEIDYFYFLDTKKKIFAAYVMVESRPISMEGYEQIAYVTNSIWKYKKSESGLMLEILLNVILLHFPHIESMHNHSIYAIKLWKEKLMPYAISDGYTCSFLDTNKETEYTFTDLMDYNHKKEYIWKSEKLIPRIYAKQ